MSTIFFTCTGDQGESNLGKKKVSKSSYYAKAIGSLDEITSWLGYCQTVISNDFVSQAIEEIQEDLFIAQAEIGSLGAGYEPSKKMTQEKIKSIERIIEKIDKEIPSITNFIIPRGSRESAVLDFGRALARRAEREIVAFSKKDTKTSEDLLKFMNRLSSILFALARYLNHVKGIKEKNPQYK
jgi:cob(I)alamin adenosyltransferase